MKQNPLVNPADWTLVGNFGVDAGLVWIGDPCYIIHADEQPSAIGKNWGDFCLNLGRSYPTMKSFKFDAGHEGLGVLCSTGLGDGVYPVYAMIKEDADFGKRIAAIFIDFFGCMSGEDDLSDEELTELCIDCGGDLDDEGYCENCDDDDEICLECKCSIDDCECNTCDVCDAELDDDDVCPNCDYCDECGEAVGGFGECSNDDCETNKEYCINCEEELPSDGICDNEDCSENEDEE